MNGGGIRGEDLDFIIRSSRDVSFTYGVFLFLIILIVVISLICIFLLIKLKHKKALVRSGLHEIIENYYSEGY